MKIAITFLLGAIGIPIGYYLAPEKPIYPFLPSEADIQIIMYKELHILFIVGLSVSILSFLSGWLLKLKTITSLLCALAAGALISIVHALRVGSLFALLPTYSIGFIIAIFCAFGIYSLLTYCIGTYAKSHK